MEETFKKKQFVQLQFCTLLLVCTLLPDFGSVLSSLFGLGGLSFTVVICRIIGIIGLGMALYAFYNSLKQNFPPQCLYSVAGGLILTIITLIPGTPVWLDYVALVVLLVSLYLSKNSLNVEWKTLSTQGAYLILLASLLNLYSNIDGKIMTNIAALVGLVIYIIGLGKLGRSLDSNGLAGVLKLKIAVWIGIVAAIIGLIPLLGTIIAAILKFIAFILEFLGYTNLKKSETLNEQGRKGAGTLRMSMIFMVIAVILGIIPFVGSSIAGVITIIALWFVFKGWNNILFGLEK
ncbi:MAG: hypothetical protein J1E57_08005 [Prevotella sp.]|nr:hypothetical protein [Prevotella sp.]